MCVCVDNTKVSGVTEDMTHFALICTLAHHGQSLALLGRVGEYLSYICLQISRIYVWTLSDLKLFYIWLTLDYKYIYDIDCSTHKLILRFYYH